MRGRPFTFEETTNGRTKRAALRCAHAKGHAVRYESNSGERQVSSSRRAEHGPADRRRHPADHRRSASSLGGVARGKYRKLLRLQHPCAREKTAQREGTATAALAGKCGFRTQQPRLQCPSNLPNFQPVRRMIDEQQAFLAQLFNPHYAENYQRVVSNNIRFVHYTSALAATQILASKSLWLRNCRTMNDFSEIEYGKHCLFQAFGAVRERLRTAEGMPRCCGARPIG
jgi:hypothetical protein